MAVLFQRIATLILRNLRQELTDEERTELFEWIESSEENQQLFSELSDEDSLRNALHEFYQSEQDVWNKVLTGIQEQVPVARVRRMRPWRFVAAASVTILIAAGAYWWLGNKSVEKPANDVVVAVKLEDVKAPTGNHSTLTLADGTVIDLDSAKNGDLVRGNSSVIKKEGVLEYTATTATNEIVLPSHHTLRTGHGGQQRLTLPDGSTVVLNAESAITYPTVFTGNMRTVKLMGEAYFEIKSIAAEGSSGKMPFIVEILSASGEHKSNVEVLGTHFVIKAYDNEASVRTTLVEGKVRVTNNATNNPQSATLIPGQQAQLIDGKLKVIKDADVQSAMGFVNNEFVFRSVDVATIFREASRWYPITVEFPNGKPRDTYSGTISRTVNLQQLLLIFHESAIKFRLEEGNKLIIQP